MLATVVVWLGCAISSPAQPTKGGTPPPKPQDYVSQVSANIPAAPDKPAVLVNGQMVSMAELKALLEARAYPNPLKAEDIRQIRSEAINMLVNDMLVRQYLGKHAPKVNQADVDKEIQNLADLLKKQNKTVKEMLKENGQTMEQMHKDIVSRLQWQGYLKACMSEEQAKKYYEDNKPFFDRIVVRASHILLKFPDKMTPEQQKTLLNQAEVLRQEIVTGKMTFDQAVLKYSQCPTRDNKDRPVGDIGPFQYKFDVVDAFAKAAFALKVNEISGVVATDYGYHIIKVTERSAAKPSTYEAVKEAVREIWSQDVELYQRMIAEQRKTSKIEVMVQ
jgi:peptidyl-prolyl cis-trans isomerase C